MLQTFFGLNCETGTRPGNDKVLKSNFRKLINHWFFFPGDPLGGITGCGELTKPTVTDQHAIRDLFTYNTSTQGSWDNFDLFHEDLAALASNTTNATNSHRKFSANIVLSWSERQGRVLISE